MRAATPYAAAMQAGVFLEAVADLTGEHDMPVSHLRLLLKLLSAGAYRQSALPAAVGISKQSVARALRRLAAMGLVVTGLDADLADLRQRGVWLTAAGEQLLLGAATEAQLRGAGGAA